jgi:hypothetical protein
MIGCVMLEGMFSRTTAYLGIITGTLGILSIGGWADAIILNAQRAGIHSGASARAVTQPGGRTKYAPVFGAHGGKAEGGAGRAVVSPGGGRRSLIAHRAVRPRLLRHRKAPSPQP